MPLEGLVYLGLLVAVAAHPGIRHLARSIPRRSSVASAGLLILLVVGQIANNAKTTFPFVPWELYTRPAPGDAVVFEYSGLTQEGEEKSLNVLGLAHSLGIGHALLGSLSRFDLAEDEADKTALEQDCRRRLSVLAGRYNQLHPGEVVRLLRVWRRRVPIRDYHGLDSITREILWEIVPASTSSFTAG